MGRKQTLVHESSVLHRSRDVRCSIGMKAREFASFACATARAALLVRTREA